MLEMPVMKWSKVFMFFITAAAGVLLAASVYSEAAGGRWNWSIISTAIMLLAVGAFFLQFERSKVTAKEIALISTLAALAALGRVPFAAIPGVQPTTFMVIISGYVFGAQAGFMVGAIAALVSNIFLGQGPWTPWQMFAWGLAGASACLLQKVRPNINGLELAVFAGAWGFIFNWIVNIWMWTSFVYPLTLESFILTCINGIWFDILHATGNVFFSITFGVMAIKILCRFKTRLKVSYLPAEYAGELGKEDGNA